MNRVETEATAGREAHPSGRLTRVLIDERRLRKRVRALGREIAADYEDRDLVVVALLKGGVYFAVDLTRAIDLPITLEFVRARSYAGTATTGQVELIWIEGLDVAGKDVLIVEDIVDTGLTLVEVWRALAEKQPATLSSCTLLYKEKLLARPFPIRYIGFAIEDVFVVGYGLDFEERFRNLPHIAVFQPHVRAG
jgi:hypoxanthine phosphoribosyltransferase